MREIKFRAWSPSHKSMITCGDWMLGELNQRTSNGFKVMQYTGLKDKNGKEIYEGDIIRNANPKAPQRKCRVVEWKSFTNGVGFNVTDKHFKRDGISGIVAKETTFTEIIGNIYENPELLK